MGKECIEENCNNPRLDDSKYCKDHAPDKEINGIYSGLRMDSGKPKDDSKTEDRED